jgi:hypothetical protein
VTHWTAHIIKDIEVIQSRVSAVGIGSIVEGLERCGGVAPRDYRVHGGDLQLVVENTMFPNAGSRMCFGMQKADGGQSCIDTRYSTKRQMDEGTDGVMGASDNS